MNGRILQFEEHRHGQVQRLLPWLVNGRLDEDERGWVEEHLGACAECKRELETLHSLQVACLQPDPAGDAAALPAQMDQGWRRLRVRLRNSQPARETPWATLQRHWQQAPRWLGAAVAAQALTLLVLVSVLWRPPVSSANYRTLGATPVASTGNLVIVFDPHLEEARMRDLLRASEARVVDGPNDAGAYVLAVPPTRLAMVRAALRAAPGVTLVATLGPGRER
ncbi:MAG: zf-HC2 protein [Xanthomonadaceae bacterium]|nr:zf-HC2 protein [Xanthomonadaceae bacterium]